MCGQDFLNIGGGGMVEFGIRIKTFSKKGTEHFSIFIPFWPFFAFIFVPFFVKFCIMSISRLLDSLFWIKRKILTKVSLSVPAKSVNLRWRWFPILMVKAMVLLLFNAYNIGENCWISLDNCSAEIWTFEPFLDNKKKMTSCYLVFVSLL